MAVRHVAGQCSCGQYHSAAGAGELNEDELAHHPSGPQRMLAEAARENRELRARVAELETANAGLRAGLDRAGGHDVYVCMHRDRDLMTAQIRNVQAGTRLRFTDHDGSLVLDEDGHWRELQD